MLHEEQKILKLSDFADLASDELTGTYDVVKGDNDTIRVNIDDRQYTPQEISAMVLQKMKKVSEDFIG